MLGRIRYLRSRCVDNSATRRRMNCDDGFGSGLFDSLLAAADRETLLMLNPLLARLVQGSERSR